MRETNLTHRYEFGEATVFTKGALAADGLVRQKYQVSIHPVGGPVMKTEIKAFFAWDAANQAIKLYKQTRK